VVSGYVKPCELRGTKSESELQRIGGTGLILMLSITWKSASLLRIFQIRARAAADPVRSGTVSTPSLQSVHMCWPQMFTNADRQ
jgi:hypothetical protein